MAALTFLPGTSELEIKVMNLIKLMAVNHVFIAWKRNGKLDFVG
jgi:hypothetical protein